MTITPSGTANTPARRTAGQVAVRTDADVQRLLADVRAGAEAASSEPAPRYVRTKHWSDSWLMASGGSALGVAVAAPVLRQIYGPNPAVAVGAIVAAFLVLLTFYAISQGVRGKRTHMQGR